MALTYVPGFFGRLGFEVVSKDDLPEKVWQVCVKCYKFNRCDEIAVMLRLDGRAAPARRPSPDRNPTQRPRVAASRWQLAHTPWMYRLWSVTLKPRSAAMRCCAASMPSSRNSSTAPQRSHTR